MTKHLKTPKPASEEKECEKCAANDPHHTKEFWHPKPAGKEKCCVCYGKKPEIVSSNTGIIDGHICFCPCHTKSASTTVQVQGENDESWKKEYLEIVSGVCCDGKGVIESFNFVKDLLASQSQSLRKENSELAEDVRRLLLEVEQKEQELRRELAKEVGKVCDGECNKSIPGLNQNGT